MNIHVLGINHTHAPLWLREQLALAPDKVAGLIDHVQCEAKVTECMVLSTCNRCELYVKCEDVQTLWRVWAEFFEVDAELLAEHGYAHSELNGLRHALQVAVGLDSMMLGEPQVLGQMKQAYQIACQYGAVGQSLSHLFEHVFAAAKRVRHGSKIGEHAMSVAYAAAKLTKQHAVDLSTARVLVIGAGETSSLCAKYCQDMGAVNFTIANRSEDNAQALAQQLGAGVIAISNLHDGLEQADIVISATACPMPFISRHNIQQTQISRGFKPLLLLDLAVPRDIESTVSQCQNVTLYNVDTLNQAIKANSKKRQVAAVHANALVQQEIQDFIDNAKALKTVPVLCDYRESLNTIADEELIRARQKLLSGQEALDVLNEFKHRLINKMLHQPSKHIRQAGIDDNQQFLDVIKKLYK